MSKSKKSYEEISKERANKKKNIDQNVDSLNLSDKDKKIIEKTSQNINDLAVAQKKATDDAKTVYKIMDKVADKNQKLEHKTLKELSDITKNFEMALHKKGKSAEEITEVGTYIASELSNDIEKVISSDRKISREELVAIEKQLPYFNKLIKSMDSANDVEIKRAKELQKLLKDSISERKQIDLSLPKLIGKEVGKQSLSSMESLFGNIESSFISAVSHDPLTAKLATGIFWLIKQSTTSVKSIWDKQKKHKELLAERLRNTQETLSKAQIDIEKNLHDEETKYLDHIEKILEKQEKTPTKIEVDNDYEQYEQPNIEVDRGEESENAFIKSIAFDVSAINKRQELVAMKAEEEALERADRDEKLLDAINDLTKSTKSQYDKKKKGLLKGVWDFITNIPALLSGGISGAIVAMLGNFKKLKIFNIFKNLKIGERLSSLSKMILSPLKSLGKIGEIFKGLKIGERLASVSNMILKPLKIIGKLGKVFKPFLKLGKLIKGIPVIGEIVMAVEGIFGFFNAKDILGKEVVNIKDRIAAGIGSIVEGLGEAGDMILGWVGIDTNMKEWLNNNFTKPLDYLLNLDFSEIWTNMKDYYSNLWTNMVTSIKGYFSDLFDWNSIKEGLSVIWESSPPKLIYNFLSDTYDYFSDIFSWNNIVKKAKDITNWHPIDILTEFTSKAKNWLKDKFSLFNIFKKKDESDIKPVDVSKPLRNAQFIPDNRDNTLHALGTPVDTRTGIRNELLPSDKYNVNMNRPIEIDAMNSEKEIQKINNLGKEININAMPKIDIPEQPSPTVVSTIQSAPRDNDPYIQYMNQVFAP